MLTALLQLQAIERQLTHVRGRLKTRRGAVNAQEKRIEQLTADHQGLLDKALACRKDADRRELDLKEREAQSQKLRTSLNTTKTNKEYAAILTQINTLKADNAKIEEEVLKMMADVDAVKAQAGKVQETIAAETQRLSVLQTASQAEIDKLNAMLADLTAKRADAAANVPREPLAVFDRIVEANDGEAMAVIEVQGRRPPFEYTCGGCYMSLNAEHANALRTRDELRTCNNCGRILYMEIKTETSDK
ncbi:MAG: C4-type zinc ribbon domain-containing protein [Phycisphaerae bacterium]|nr:C4-type zinc ribbon domain-containing protein [Phycisphaerae bacterium]